MHLVGTEQLDLFQFNIFSLVIYIFIRTNVTHLVGTDQMAVFHLFNICIH